MRRDWDDLLGGLALTLVGAAALVWSILHYDLGSLRQMGPGFFPAGLGGGLAILGLIVALPALNRSGAAAPFEGRTALAVIAAIVIFGLGLTRLGLVPASALAVAVASLPAPHPGWLWRGALVVVVTGLTVLVFHFGLRMTIPLWPRLS
jgi:hypothetical protein